MRLLDHADYRDLLIAAAGEHGLPEVFVEKDYWITEILRVVQTALPDRAIFKGGTSLSKGWGLIRRFSEDVDLFVNPDVEPRLGRNAVDRTLRDLRDAVRGIAGLELVAAAAGESRTKKGKERSDDFEYVSVFPDDVRVPPTVRLEAGIQSGKQPVERLMISSLLADFVAGEPGLAEQLGAPPDLLPFEMNLLAFRRTFVEKLFTIHGKIERFQADGVHPGRDLRHYADLYLLAETNEVREMLRSPEYAEICADYDENSRRFYPSSHRPPAALRFTASAALFPGKGLREALEAEYDRECRVLFDGPYPAFGDVLATFEVLRPLL